MGLVERGMFARLLIPIRWHIEVAMVDAGKWRLSYTEFFKRPEKWSKEKFVRVVKRSERLAKEVFGKLMFQDSVSVRFDVGEDEAVITIKFEAPLDVIAGAIVGEFMAQTRLGKMTLNELLLLSLPGTIETIQILKKRHQKGGVIADVEDSLDVG